MHNFSASNLQYMEEHVWPGLKYLNMNTVVFPIYWETIEAEKDRYDFVLLDGLIIQARNNIWFCFGSDYGKFLSNLSSVF